MDCSICFEKFDSEDHRPKVLQCGHSFCLSCLDQLPVKKCPVDRQVSLTCVCNGVHIEDTPLLVGRIERYVLVARIHGELTKQAPLLRCTFRSYTVTTCANVYIVPYLNNVVYYNS